MSNTVLPLIPLRPAPPPAPPCGAPAVPELPPRDALASAVRELAARLAAISAALPPGVSPSNRIADRAYVVQALSELVGGAPAAYDTLKEIADWIADDESGAAKIVADVLALRSGKQDAIADLAAIRAGAAKGATAVQDVSGKRDKTDFSVGDGWLLVKPDGAPVWMVSRGDPDAWFGDDELEPRLYRDSGSLGEAWIFSIGPQASGERAQLDIPYSEFPIDSAVIVVNLEASTYFDGVYRLVRGSRLALDTEIPPEQAVDSAVTRTSANPVKSSGIWSAIWGDLTALPTGITALYDWVVAQLAGKLGLSGGVISGDLRFTGPATSQYGVVFVGGSSFADTPVNALGMYDRSNGPLNLGRYIWFWPHVRPDSRIDEGKKLVLAGSVPKRTSDLVNDGGGDGSPFATVSQIPDVSDKADAADLRYRIAEAEFDASIGAAGGYILADRTVNRITPQSGTSIDIELPELANVGRMRDFYVRLTVSATSASTWTIGQGESWDAMGSPPSSFAAGTYLYHISEVAAGVWHCEDLFGVLNRIPMYPMVGVTPSNGTLIVSPYTVATYTAGDSAAAFMVGVGTGETGKARDCELVIDCTATGAVAPTVTWPSMFHPRTDAATDFACEAGKRNVYFISEYATGNFAVGGWQETSGGNA